MAVPKRKTSKSKRDMRRTHDKISGPQTMECPQCGEAVMRHHVCGECGHYKGREVIAEDED